MRPARSAPATPPAPPARRVYTFTTSAREAIVAETYLARGVRRLAFRVVTLTPGGVEAYTRTGFSIDARHLPELEAAVRALRAAVDGTAVPRTAEGAIAPGRVA